MGDKRFRSSPFADLALSARDKLQLRELANHFVQENFRKYVKFVVQDKRRVDERRWQHIKSKENLHIYSERVESDATRVSSIGTSGVSKAPASSLPLELPVLLSVGTHVGQLDDLMLGVVNPTLDSMHVKASYVHDVDSAAVLASIVEPTVEKPFESVTIKWMQIDLPLATTSLVKNRDYVYMEATGLLQFDNGDRVGYHMLHSIDFPQTHKLRHKIRGNLSVCGFFRQLEGNVIDNFAGGTVDPAGEIKRFLLIPAAADSLLSATNYVYCGQMKKLSWMLQHRQSAAARQTSFNPEISTGACVACGKQVSGTRRNHPSKDACRLCYGSVCHSCRVRERVSFLTPEGKLHQRKVPCCRMCMSEVTKMNALEAACDQARGFGAYRALRGSLPSDSSLEAARSYQRSGEAERVC